MPDANKKLTDEEKRIRNRDRSRKYRLENPDKVKEIGRKASAKYRAANGEKRNAKIAEWQAANRERSLATTKAWQGANPDRVKAAQARYRQSNLESVRAKQKRWREANKEKIAAKRKAEAEKIRVYAANRRSRVRENGGQLSPNIVEKLLSLQKGLCACCRKPLGDRYHIDHVMPIALGGENSDSNVQLLRQECNNQKHAKHPVDFMQSRGFLL